MVRKSVVGAVLALLLIGLVTWRLWPEDDPSLRDELAEVSGVTAVEADEQDRAGRRIVLDPDADLESVDASVRDLVRVVDAHKDLRVEVDIGGVVFAVTNDGDPDASVDADQKLDEGRAAWAAAAADDIESGDVWSAANSGGTVAEVAMSAGTRLERAAGQVADRLVEAEAAVRSLTFSSAAPNGEASRFEIRDLDAEVAKRQARSLADALTSTGARLVEGRLHKDYSSLTVWVGKQPDLDRVRATVLREFASKNSSLKLLAPDGVEIGSAERRPPAEALALAAQVRATGAEVSTVEADLSGVEIEASDRREAAEVLTLMNDPGWALAPDAHVVLALLSSDDNGTSKLTGDTDALLEMGPLFQRVVGSGFHAEFQEGENGDDPVFGVWEVVDDGESVRSLEKPRHARQLIDVLRSGEWSGRMTFEIASSSSVFTRFSSTATGPAEKVERAKVALDEDRSGVAALNSFVTEWNRTAD